ncbi:MAG: OsmC family protein [Anaerolineae bacterium]
MAGKAHVQWISKGQFVGIDGTKHSVVMSRQDEENATGMKPSDMLLVALGGCTSVDIVNILKKKRQKLTGLEIDINGEQAPEPPWAFRSIHITYTVRGRGLTEKAVADAIRLAEEKYCSVKASLDKSIEIHTQYQIIEDE